MNQQSTIQLKNNIGINYLQNRQDGLPVLMLHGNSLGKEIYINQIKSPLFEKYRMIAMDLPGHGGSQVKKGELTLTICLELILQFIESLSIKNAIVLGHSLGGHLAIKITTQVETIQGLFLTGTPPLTKAQKNIEPFLRNRINQLLFKPDLSLEEIAEVARSMDPTEQYVEELIKIIKESDNRLRTDIMKMIQTGNYEDECLIMDRFQKPKTIVFGANDPLINPDYIKWLLINEPWGKIIRTLPDAGHCTMIEKPDEFNVLLLEFIDKAQLNI